MAKVSLGGKLALLFPFNLFLHKMSPYFLINSLAHHKLVLPRVTGFVRKHASFKADFTLVVV